jgi:hypothetical protein
LIEIAVSIAHLVPPNFVVVNATFFLELFGSNTKDAKNNKAAHKWRSLASLLITMYASGSTLFAVFYSASTLSLILRRRTQQSCSNILFFLAFP